MVRALYSASSGMVAQTIRQDAIAHNLANVQTAGFKRQRVVAASFEQTLRTKTLSLADRTRLSYPDSPSDPVTVSAESATDRSQGALETTGNVLDFAIQGPGAFEVATPSGTSLTRGGSFRTGPNGELVTADGAIVQGQAGPIVIPKGEWRVTPDGAVLARGTEVAKIKVVGADPGATQVLQGCVESANVNAVSEMVDMIANMRAYEANQRVIASVDQSLEKLISEVGRV